MESVHVERPRKRRRSSHADRGAPRYPPLDSSREITHAPQPPNHRSSLFTHHVFIIVHQVRRLLNPIMGAAMTTMDRADHATHGLVCWSSCVRMPPMADVPCLGIRCAHVTARRASGQSMCRGLSIIALHCHVFPTTSGRIRPPDRRAAGPCLRPAPAPSRAAPMHGHHANGKPSRAGISSLDAPRPLAASPYTSAGYASAPAGARSAA